MDPRREKSAQQLWAEVRGSDLIGMVAKSVSHQEMKPGETIASVGIHRGVRNSRVS